MTKELENLVENLVTANSAYVRWLACSPAGGEKFEELVDNVSTGVSQDYLKRKSRKTVRPETQARYESEAAEAAVLVRERMRSLYFTSRRKREVALLEFPLLQIRISEGLGKQGIPYLFATDKDENVLTVQVVGPYFWDIPVTLETVDRVVSLTRYFINRPEYAKEEMPQIRHRQSQSLARDWDTLTANCRI